MSRWWPERATLWVWPSKAEPMLASAERELDARALPRGSRLSCVLAGEGVRWRIVPWNDALASPAHRSVLAASCFAEAYGDASRAWTLRVDAGRHGAATLACAIDTALLDQLDALARARGLRLVSVQPALMRAFNECRRQLAGDTFWFVWAAGTGLTLLLMSAEGAAEGSRQVPLAIRSLPAGADLGRHLAREWFSLGMAQPRCPVYVARAASTPAVPLPPDWPAVELPPIDDTPFAAAPAERHAA